MNWSWPPWRRHQDTTVDTTDEAQAALAVLERRDAEVADLGATLRAAQRRNHFSLMVSDAITRTRET